MNKYIILFLKNRLLIISVTGTLFFLLYFFVLLFNNNVYTPIFAFWAFVPMLIWFCIDILLTIRFQRLIRYQEEYLNVVFNDINAVPLFPKSMTYLSDDWLIFSGKLAFHSQYIESISIIASWTSMGKDYKLKIQTCTGKTYMKSVDSYRNAIKIKHWFENTTR